MSISRKELQETEVLLDGRVLLGQTDHAENPRIMSFRASFGGKWINQCLLCQSEPTTFAVFVPGTPGTPHTPVFSRQGKRMTFSYGLCRRHVWPPDFEAIEERVSRIMMFDALGGEVG